MCSLVACGMVLGMYEIWVIGMHFKAQECPYICAAIESALHPLPASSACSCPSARPG